MHLFIRRCLLATVLVVASGCADSRPDQQAASASPSKGLAETSGELAPVLNVLQRQGLRIQGQFDAPSGLRGYAGEADGRPIAIYLTSDGQHALVGTLIDAQGQDVGAEPLRRLVSEPASRELWDQLQNSRVVVDGREDAPRVIYTFTDPNCPYCNAFWRAARPWVAAGKVQLRHVLVGIIKEDSATKAAAILQAKVPVQALTYNEEHHGQGGIKPAASVSRQSQQALQENLMLMTRMGFQGTPAIVFKDAAGQVQTRSGMPQGADLEAVLGPK